MNLYPMFMTNHNRMLDVIFYENEEDRRYVEKMYGIPIGYQTIDGIVSKKEIDKCPLDMRSPSYIASNNLISEFFRRIPFEENLTDYAIQYFNSLGFDIKQIYEAKISYTIKQKSSNKTTTDEIFAGAEIILFPSYLRKIAEKLGCNFYIYLTDITSIKVIPETAILSDKGVLNFYNEMCCIKDQDNTKRFYNGIFYFDQKTDEPKLLYHFEKNFDDNWEDEKSPE